MIIYVLSWRFLSRKVAKIKIWASKNVAALGAIYNPVGPIYIPEDTAIKIVYEKRISITFHTTILS